MATRAVYDLTLLDENGDPFFGSLSSGIVSESDFQTPDESLSHDRPHLLPPEDFTSAKVDFPRGTSTIGVVSVKLLDKRQTETDQDSGILTSVADRVTGARAILRRYRPSAGSWVTVMDGPVESYRLSPEVVALTLNLRDGRDFERNDELFASNFVLWGKDGATGPAVDYGDHPAIRAVFGSLARPMVEAVEPFESVADGGINHFAPFSDLTYLGGQIHGGFATVATDVVVNGETVERTLELPDLGEPVVDNSDGLPKYTQIRIRWRPKGSSDPWTVLRDMPTLPTRSTRNVVDTRWGILQGPNVIPGGGEQAVSKPAIWFGSFEESDIPNAGQEIEFQVLAEEITEEHPFFWDSGTLGVLLDEIASGDHSETAPREQYDEAEIQAFRTNSPTARMILREKVTDRRKWVEENIYKVAFRAPAFTENYELFPAEWELPDNAESVPVLDADSVQPVGEWEHGIGNAIGRVNYTYIREHLVDEEVYRLQNDLDDDVPVDVWDRFREEKVELFQEADDAVVGAKTLDYAPITVRAMGHRGGLVHNEDWWHDPCKPLAEKAFGLVLPRFKRGAATYVATVQATDENLAYHIGDWVRVRVDWLPEYSIGKRGLRRYMQVYGISDVSTERRELFLVDGGVPDPTSDPDLTDPGEVDCFAGGTAIGGTLVPAPNGGSCRYFLEDGYVVNSCSKDVTVKLLSIGGGGGGGGTSGTGVGGGGGAGGVLVVEEVTIPAGASVPVTIGQGGAVDANGGDTVIWLDTSTGTVLDPLSDPSPSDLTAVGGGAGGGEGTLGHGGGSGGGGGATFKGEVIDNTGGGGGTTGQGNDGGGGQGHGGALSDESAGGGGGGSYAEAGEQGDANVAGNVASAGSGGSSSTLSEFGVTAGGGGTGGVYVKDLVSGEVEQDAVGPAGDDGYGAGGGGANSSGGATTGTDGFVAVIYAGAPATLSPPSITSTQEVETSGLQMCVDEDEWPVIDLPGYRVRVEYAVGTESAPIPSDDSGDWQLAGYLEAPGCIYTDPIPNGAHVWKRVRAEARDFQPSEWSTVTSETYTQTPDFLFWDLTIDPDTGIGTLTWTENPYTGGARIRALTHGGSVDASDLAPDLPLIDDVAASDGSYVLSTITVARGDYLTVDLEAWESELTTISRTTQGLIFRDDFNRADSTTVGNGWVEEEASWEIFSNHLRMQDDSLSARSINNDQAVGTGDFIAQLNFRTTEGNGSQILQLRDASDNRYRVDVKYTRNPAWVLSERTSGGTVNSLDTHDETLNENEWNTMRLVYDASESRLKVYRALAISAQDDLSNDLTEILNAVHALGAIDIDNLRLTMRKDTGAGATEEYDQDEVFISGRAITVTGLPSGYQVQVDSRSAVTESGGSVTINPDDWALPATTLKVLDDEGSLVTSLSPSGGVWGGDQYSFISEAGSTQGRRRRVSKRRPPESVADAAANALDRLTWDRTLGLTVDRSLNPVKTRS